MLQLYDSEYEREQFLECVIDTQSIHTMNIHTLSTKFNVIEHGPHIDTLIWDLVSQY